jgi:hypothetical protein
MTVIITKYFIEKTDADFEIYNKLWEENSHSLMNYNIKY